MTDIAASSHFDAGRVVQNMLRTISQNAVLFFGVAIGLIMLPYIVSQVIAMPTRTAAEAVRAGTATTDQIAGMAGLGALAGLVGILSAVLGLVGQGMLFKGSIMSLQGQAPSFGPMWNRGWSAFFPILGFVILFGLAVGFGTLFFIIPGLFLGTMWMVGLPALVAERCGVFGAFSRSSELTRNHRWICFGLWLAFVVIAWVVQCIGIAVFGGFVGAGGFMGYLAVMQRPLLPLIIYLSITQTLFSVLGIAGFSALYEELRRVKDGLLGSGLSETFA